MAAAAIRSWPARAASTWRALGRMPAYQLPIVLGGALAVFAGAGAFVAAVVAERGLGVSWGRGLLLVAFGAPALIGYKGMRANVRNGSGVGAIARVGPLPGAGGAGGLGT